LHGRPVEAYAATLLEEAADLPAALPVPSARNMVELFSPLRDLTLATRNIRDFADLDVALLIPWDEV
jgi:hypothetical protein